MKLLHLSSLLTLSFLGLLGGLVLETCENSLRLWGKDLGHSLTTLSVINLFHMMYAFKVFWSPLIAYPFRPFMTSKFWLFCALNIGAISLLGMTWTSFFSPVFFLCLIGLTFSRASFDMLVVSLQKTLVPHLYWGMAENFCVNGYRLGMMLMGVLSLSYASTLIQWPFLLKVVAISLMLLSPLIFRLPIPESKSTFQPASFKQRFTEPILAFLQNPLWKTIILLMIFYRVQDSFLDPMKDLFLLNLGISKIQIAGLNKVMGLWMGIVGAMASGFAIRFWGFQKTLSFGCIIHAFVTSLFLLIPSAASFWMLSGILAAEQCSKGFAMISFFSFQLVCAQEKHSLTQLAIMTAVTSLSTQAWGGLSGIIVDLLGWKSLFMIAIAFNAPVLFLLKQYFEKKDRPSSSVIS